MKKKILIFTGSRADYGLLKPLISRIKKDKRYKFLKIPKLIHYGDVPAALNSCTT